MFNAMNQSPDSPTPKKSKKDKEDNRTALEKILDVVDPNRVLVASAQKYQKRMTEVEDTRKAGFSPVQVRQRYVPDYVTTGYQAANAAKALRARFEGDICF